MAKKFKAFEKNAKNAPVKNIEWEGEEVTTHSQINLEEDTGTGKEVILRFFDFGVNFQAFKNHKPSAQELFDNHRQGLESLMWRDGLRPFEEVEPRLIFSKDKKHYRFIIACTPTLNSVLTDKPQTLSQLLTNKS